MAGASKFLFQKAVDKARRISITITFQLLNTCRAQAPVLLRMAIPAKATQVRPAKCKASHLEITPCAFDRHDVVDELGRGHSPGGLAIFAQRAGVQFSRAQLPPALRVDYGAVRRRRITHPHSLNGQPSCAFFRRMQAIRRLTFHENLPLSPRRLRFPAPCQARRSQCA